MPITSALEDRLAQMLCKTSISLFTLTPRPVLGARKSILHSNIKKDLDHLTQYIYEVMVHSDIGLHKDKIIVLSSHSSKEEAYKCMAEILETGKFATIRKKKMF